MCDFNQEKLAAYLDNELNPAERAVVEAHLAGCPECRGFLDCLRNNDRLFCAAVQTEQPADFWQVYNVKLRQRLTGQASVLRHRLIWYALVPAAAAVLIAFTAYRLFMPTQVIPDRPIIPPHITTTAEVETAISPEKVLAGSEAALVNLVNMNENDPIELTVFQTALAESGLVERIRSNKIEVKDDKLREHFNKLEAVFTWAQNGNSAPEITALKEVINNNGLIEENRLKRHSY